MVRKILTIIGHLIGLSLSHEIGHLLGLIICGVTITHFFVPFWLHPITIVPFFQVHDTVNLWVWGWKLNNASLDLFPILFHIVITPLLFEIVYVQKMDLSWKVLIPFSLVFKWNDLWIVSEAIRTFLFVHYGIVY
ncbi:MAG: hypothetical protein ACFFAU_21105 [Candidatus Hodarchaeota archaeon]